MVKDELGFLWCGINNGFYQIDLLNYFYKYYFDNVEFNKCFFYRNKDIVYMGFIDGLYIWIFFDFIVFILVRQLYFLFVIIKWEEIGFRRLYLMLFIVVLFMVIVFGFLFLLWWKNKIIKEFLYEQFFFLFLVVNWKVLIDEFIYFNINIVMVYSFCEFLDFKKNEFYVLMRILYCKILGQFIREKCKVIVLEIYKNNFEMFIDELVSIVGYLE